MALDKTPKADLGHIIEQLRPLAVACESLTLDPRNARSHDERNMQAISSSLDRFGQRLPIVVQRTGMMVRAGNGRLMAARALGWRHIAAVVTDDADEMAAAFALADNRTAELASWNEEELAATLTQLQSVDYDIPELGWTTEELEAITGVFNVDGVDMPALGNESASPYQQITFTLTPDQMAEIKKAVTISKGNGPFGDTGNPNSNGNALHRICVGYTKAQQSEF